MQHSFGLLSLSYGNRSYDCGNIVVKSDVALRRVFFYDVNYHPYLTFLEILIEDQNKHENISPHVCCSAN